MIFIGPEKAAAAGKLAGRCSHRPLRMRGPAGFWGLSRPPGGDAPLSRLTPTAPLAGAPLGNCRKKPPLQGEVDATQAQTEGCGTLAGPLRLWDVCAARAGSDACISPRCLRRRQAAGRCEHHPLRMRGRRLAGACRAGDLARCEPPCNTRQTYDGAESDRQRPFLIPDSRLLIPHCPKTSPAPGAGRPACTPGSGGPSGAASGGGNRGRQSGRRSAAPRPCPAACE